MACLECIENKILPVFHSLSTAVRYFIITFGIMAFGVVACYRADTVLLTMKCYYRNTVKFFERL